MANTPYTPETLQRISQLRAKAVEGTLTLDEAREGVALLRQDRKSAAASSDTSRRARAKAAIPHADDLLDELGNI